MPTRKHDHYHELATVSFWWDSQFHALILKFNNIIIIMYRAVFHFSMVLRTELLLLLQEDVSSPNRGGGGPIFDFCDPELFSETLQTSEVDSPSHGGYEENSSYANNSLNISQEVDNLNTNYQDTAGNTNTITTTTSSTATLNSSSNLSLIFDSPDEINNDISASIDFSSSPQFSTVLHPFLTGQQQQQQNHHDQFDLSLSQQQQQMPLTDAVISAITEYSASDHVPPLMAPPMPCVFEEDCLSSVPSFMPLNPSSPSCSLLAPSMAAATFMSAGTMAAALSAADSNGLFSVGILSGSEMHPQEVDFQGDNGRLFCPTSLQRIFNPADLQALSSESQQLVNGVAGSTPLASEITSLEDSAFNKVGKLSVEQRKEKISRYMKKRNERNFSKKIKYACRKTLADSRPRVRGRFAKNDDFGETTRTASSNHEDDDEEEVCVKEEEDMVDSAEIYAHITGLNSFKCNYPIQSWI